MERALGVLELTMAEGIDSREVLTSFKFLLRWPRGLPKSWRLRPVQNLQISTLGRAAATTSGTSAPRALGGVLTMNSELLRYHVEEAKG